MSIGAWVGILSAVVAGCAASKQAEEPVNPAPAAQEAQTVWMQKPDGSKQCGFAKGVEPETMANQLKSQGISVLQARKGSDGLMHAMVCGGDTGTTVDVEVRAADARKLKRLGFRPVP